MKRALVLAIAACSLVATAVAVAQPDAGRPGAAASPGTAQIACGRTRTIGLAAPVTGPAGSLGQQQERWARYFVTRYNRGHRNKLRMITGDTQLPDTAQAIQVAERFASNQQILVVVGPAGSQEVQVSTRPLRSGGLAFITGSATLPSLTLGGGPRRGYFFRTVPNDEVQGRRVTNYIRRNLRASRVVVVDAQNSYSVGLADIVQRRLRQAGATVRRESVNEATVTDFSSLVARIPANTQVVYTPWQLAPKAQLLGQQLRAAGKRATMFGSDGLYDPSNFRIPGSYVSAFPVNLNSAALRAYKRAHGGKGEEFGLPSYVATQVAALAIEKACRDNQATRAEVRRFVQRTNIPKSQSLLGFRIRYSSVRRFPVGPGDMLRPADYILWRINARGRYVLVR
jgi:branched-chain amino acid transport system substrate-binding protein